MLIIPLNIKSFSLSKIFPLYTISIVSLLLLTNEIPNVSMLTSLEFFSLATETLISFIYVKSLSKINSSGSITKLL